MLSEHDRLRSRVDRLLAVGDGLTEPLMQTLGSLQSQGCRVIMFGGALRDLMLSRRPRDIDLVVDGSLADVDFEAALAPFTVRKTRFGGLHLNVGGGMYDVWPLHRTWAFKHTELVMSIRQLPRTTFLNLEAIAVEVDVVKRCVREIHSYGFFQALRSRSLDVNLAINPFPSLAAIRAIVVAIRFEFAISSRLTDFVRSETRSQSVRDLVGLQLQHYKRVFIDEDGLEVVLQQIRSAAPGVGVRPNLPGYEQLPLDFSEIPPY